MRLENEYIRLQKTLPWMILQNSIFFVKILRNFSMIKITPENDQSLYTNISASETID